MAASINLTPPLGLAGHGVGAPARPHYSGQLVESRSDLPPASQSACISKLLAVSGRNPGVLGEIPCMDQPAMRGDPPRGLLPFGLGAINPIHFAFPSSAFPGCPCHRMRVCVAAPMSPPAAPLSITSPIGPRRDLPK